MKRRQALRLLGAAGCAVGAGWVGAQSDDAAIRMLVGLSPGGGNDFVSRVVAEQLHQQLKRPAVVENKPGAGQQIAFIEVKRAAPDGRTLLSGTTGPLTIYPHIYKKLDYDPFKDFTPIASVASFDVAIAVGPMLPASTMAEALAKARSDPSLAIFGTPGNGSLSHFVGLATGLATDTRLTHLPYRDINQAALDLAAGRLPILITGLSQMLQMSGDSKVKVLAVSGARRSSAMPDVPTLSESGVQVSSTTTSAIFGPAGMPRELVDRLSAACQGAVSAPGMREKLAKFGFSPAPAGPAQLTALIANEYKFFQHLVKETGYQAE